MKEQIKQILLLLGFIVLVVAGLVWLTRDSKSPASADLDGIAGGVLTVDETDFDFGSVSMAKGVVNHEFVLENKSDQPVKIGEVSTSCMCTTAELRVDDQIAGPFGMPGHGLAKKARLTVDPGKKLVVKAIFDPAAHGPAGVGVIEREVSLDTGGEEPTILRFKANVNP